MSEIPVLYRRTGIIQVPVFSKDLIID